jgi:hypothetical protein
MRDTGPEERKLRYDVLGQVERQPVDDDDDDARSPLRHFSPG